MSPTPPTPRDAVADADSAPLDRGPVTPDRQGHPASVRIQRRVEWAQTDAAGHHHWSAVLHWVEQAETVLHERLGIAHRTFGREPRVHVSVDFSGRLYFRDLVEIEITVQRGRQLVGALRVHRHPGGRDGRVGDAWSRCTSTWSTGRAQPWPDDLRAALTGGGEQVPELVGAG